MGRLWFEALVREGLLPSSRLLDVGCGTLRLGYWLMHFLEPGHYYGLEPQVDMLEAGRTEIIEPHVLERAKPHFAHNFDFDFSVREARSAGTAHALSDHPTPVLAAHDPRLSTLAEARGAQRQSARGGGAFPGAISSDRTSVSQHSEAPRGAPRPTQRPPLSAASTQ